MSYTEEFEWSVASDSKDCSGEPVIISTPVTDTKVLYGCLKSKACMCMGRYMVPPYLMM